MSIRTYSKPETGIKECRELITPIASVLPQQSLIPIQQNISATGRSYVKNTGTRDYRLIVLIMEDAKRTYSYLQILAKKITSGFKIFPVRDLDRGIPAWAMSDQAKASEIECGLIYEEGDELYMICDVDHYHSDLLRLSKEKAPCWNLIISNPCVEIWFFYHYIEDKPDFTVVKEVEKRSKYMHCLCADPSQGGHISGGIDVRKLCELVNIEKAIGCSKNHYVLEENGVIPELASTQMHILMERIKLLL